MKFEIVEKKLKRKIKGKILASNSVEQVGFAKYCIKERNMLIEEIEVYTQSRKKGIGTTMVNILKEIAKRKGCKSIWLYSLLNAIEFWERMGFGVTSINQMEFEINAPATTELMRWLI